MNVMIKRACLVILILVSGLAWLNAQAGKPEKVTVTEAIPSEGIQGQALGVRIKGTGFDHGSQVRFLISGTRDDSQIDVGAVRFDAATGDLVADVQVKDQAQAVEYDVEVKTSSGRRGKGTTLFRVRQKFVEDPCLTTTSAFPSFAFWRDTGSTADKWKTVFISSQDGTCERTLLELPFNNAFNGWWGRLSFSFDAPSGKGRVMWAVDINPRALWVQDFTVGAGNTILPAGSPQLILEVPEPPDPSLDGSYLRAADLSPSGERIAFSYTAGGMHGIYLLDVANCLGASAPCTPLDRQAILEVGQFNANGNAVSFNELAWGPVGMRVYAVEKTQLPDDIRESIRYVTDADGDDAWVDQGELISPEEYLEHVALGDVASGIADTDGRGPREKLALRRGGGCHEIAIVDVLDCETGENGGCSAERRFFGWYPSWTKAGTLIHQHIERGRYNKRRGYNCWFEAISEWAPGVPGVRPMMDGEQPDAG